MAGDVTLGRNYAGLDSANNCCWQTYLYVPAPLFTWSQEPEIGLILFWYCFSGGTWKHSLTFKVHCTGFTQPRLCKHVKLKKLRGNQNFWKKGSYRTCTAQNSGVLIECFHFSLLQDEKWMPPLNNCPSLFGWIWWSEYRINWIVFQFMLDHMCMVLRSYCRIHVGWIFICLFWTLFFVLH